MDNSNYGMPLMKLCLLKYEGGMVFLWGELLPKILDSCEKRLGVHSLDGF
jgi:hypothetical protein